jgi:two-component system sensor histidine kinase/response regulator
MSRNEPFHYREADFPPIIRSTMAEHQDRDLQALAEENQRLRNALVQQEERANELQAKLNVIARAARMWAWEAGVQADFIWDLNRPSELGLDHVPIEELGPRFFVMIDPRDLQRLLEEHVAAVQSKAATVVHRYRVKLPDGTHRHYEGRGAFSYFDNSPPRCVGINLDVTEEVKADALLRQQTADLRDAQRRLERASLSSQEGHWDFDLSTQRLWVSSSYYQLLGYTDDMDLRTREQHLEMIHPDDRSREDEAFREHIARNTPLDAEVRMRPANGEWRWMRLRGMAEFDDAHRPIRISGSVQDIHEKKLAEDNLLLVSQRFERAIRGTQDGLWEWDLERGTLWISPRYEAILGYEEGTLRYGAEVRDAITHPDDLARVAAAHQAHFAGLGPLDVEARMQHADGNYIWIRVRGEAERDASGKPVRIAGSIQDITEARAAHDELIQATKAAQAANSAKSDFLANVSHEIRTPMNGIMGMSALILDTELNHTQMEYAETIRNSADSLLTVINDILDFSKIEAGKLDIEILELDLRRTVEDVGTLLGLQAASKHLDLIVNVRPDVPDRVHGDPQRIRQCLINLAGNAVKFTPTGEVVLDVGVVGRENGKIRTRFEVRDSGIGIDAAAAKNLFQPFVQADSSTTRYFGGTGLGLSIVRRLVEMMGGEIGMRSEPGKGSTFWFELPLSADAPARVAIAHEPARRLLLADCSRTMRELTADHLTATGYTVTIAGDAETAMALLREALVHDRPFAVALIDRRIDTACVPGLIEQVRGSPQLSTLHAVMLSYPNSGNELTEFNAQGFDALLTKPLRTRELLDHLDRFFSAPEAVQGPAQPTHTRGGFPDTTHTRTCGGRVLLVEDNAVNQKVAQRFLERLGCSVTIAGNGAKAVTACELESFDLILMDLQMPVMDGYAATREIRMKEPGSRVPIIALTANAMTGQLERCLAADMDGLLTKPLLPDRLRETLERFGLKHKGGYVDGASPI